MSGLLQDPTKVLPIVGPLETRILGCPGILNHQDKLKNVILPDDIIVDLLSERLVVSNLVHHKFMQEEAGHVIEIKRVSVYISLTASFPRM